MNRRIGAIIGLIFLGVLVFGAGIVTGQMWGTAANWQPGWMMNRAAGTVQPGANMMANQGNMMDMMGGSGRMNGSGMMNGNMMGMMGMMGNVNADAEITVTAEEAVTLAQEYLDANLPGSTAREQVNSCPGHYALQVERDGEIIGMIGINAYNGQVFLHQWNSNVSQIN